MKPSVYLCIYLLLLKMINRLNFEQHTKVKRKTKTGPYCQCITPGFRFNIKTHSSTPVWDGPMLPGAPPNARPHTEPPASIFTHHMG